MAKTNELLHGTLDALILKTLSWGPRHGYAIARWIASVTSDALLIEEGSLYPALYRLEKRAWIEAEWGTSETKRRVKFYKLTEEGRRQLVLETAQWSTFSEAVGRIILSSANPSHA